MGHHHGGDGTGRHRFHGAGLFSVARAPGISGYPDDDRDGHRTGKSRADRVGAVAGVAALPGPRPTLSFRRRRRLDASDLHLRDTRRDPAAAVFLPHQTRFGILMQATAQDLHTARLVGIPVNRTIAVAFAVGAVLSGIAGLLVAPIFLAEPTMGGSLGLKGFVVSVIGGFGNLPGAVIGGLFLGLIETFGARYISSNFRDAYAFIVMIAVLVAWPRGLFGEKSSEKV